MNILVTGGAGFIGSRIAALLVAAGHDVTVLDDLSVGRRANVPPTARLVEADIRDAAKVAIAVRSQDAVVHLAAQALVPESVARPDKAFEINLLGGHNLLEAMRACGVGRLVYSSTAAVYGTPVRVPIAEDDLKLPITPYGGTKLAFESLASAYHAAYGLSVTTFRYFNPYGPTEAHDLETHAIPNFIHATLSGQPIPLYWDGQQIRDFFYVDDIARAHILGLTLGGFHTYNLGSGSGIKVRDVLELIFKIAGCRSSIQDLGERPGDPMQLLADTSRVRREIGWQPETSLETGLERTIAAFRERNQ
jgi:UDP-glucose 4-epimerase